MHNPRMLQPVRRSPFSKLVLVISILLPFFGVARAQTIYTNSSTSGSVSWSTGPNWSATPVSSSNTAIRFQGTLGGNLAITQDTGANFVLNALTIANSGAFAMNFTGGAFEFSKSGTTNPVLTFVNNSNTIQTFSNNFVLNDTLTVNQAGATVSNSTIAGVISGAGGLRKSGNGHVYLTGTNNSFGGGVTNSAGTLFVSSIGNAGSNSSLGTNGTIVLGDGSSANALRTINTAAEASDKAISLGGSTINTRLENYSGGVLTLNGAIDTVNNAGKVLYIVARSNNVVLGGAIAASNAASNNLALHLTNSAGFNLVLVAANAYRGGTTVWNGGLNLSNNSALGTGTLTWQTNGSLVALTTLDISNEIVVGSGTGSAGMALTATGNQSLTNKVSGVISGTGGLRLNTVGVTAYPANTNNSFAGGFFLQQGTLVVATVGSSGNNSPLGTNGIVYVGTATNPNSTATFKYLGNGETTDKTLWLGGTNTTFSSIDQSGQGVLKFTADVVATNLGPKTLFLEGSSSGAGELAGIISNSSSSTVSLAKRGTGTWTLSGSNAFTGPTSVEAGTLVVSGSLPTNTVTISNGATVAGLGRIGGNVAVSGILDPGTADTKGPLTVNGSLTVETNGAVSITIDSIASYDRVAGTNAVTINGAINVAASGSYSPANGNTFVLFNGPIGGAPVLNLTPLADTNFVWVTNNFIASGQVSVSNIAPVLTPYGSWLTNYPSITNFPGGAANTNGAADPDGDGFNNNMEFAFDGNPTVGTPALIGAASSGGSVVVSFLASTNTNAVSYMVQSTTNLSTGPWADNSGLTASITNSANQTNPPILLTPAYVRREFTAPMATSNSFYRVRATIAP